MRLTASDFVTYYRPSECGLRVYLREKGQIEAEPSEFDKVLRRLGSRHEQSHLATLGTYLDLSGSSEAERIARTKLAISEAVPIIYQPAFAVETSINKIAVTIVGYPDFLVFGDGSYLIRDSKLSLRVDEANHPEIILQLQLYGWLFERTTGRRAKALQAFSGRGEIVEVAYDDGRAAFAKLEAILGFKIAASQPYEPVGWSKCSGCGFNDRCWSLALTERSVATIPDVDQGLARLLESQGVQTRAQLLSKYDAEGLAEVKRMQGSKMIKVGQKANRILLFAEIMEKGLERVLGIPQIPASSNYVMFDLEGMPPHLDEMDKIYLWGAQVFGSRPSQYQAATAGFGECGDAQGWADFLQIAKRIFENVGDIPFVHWAAYEKTYISKYSKRYGDPDGIAARVLTNLIDLFTITKASIALPVPSFSLKVIEEYLGYKQTQEEYGGAWAMAKFIEATETSDLERRNVIMNEILKYNQEDLEAMYMVFTWLCNKRPSAEVGASALPAQI
jgi:predicted RecB family nuclease